MEKLFNYLSADLKAIAALGDSCGNWTPAQEKQFKFLTSNVKSAMDGLGDIILEAATKP